MTFDTANQTSELSMWENGEVVNTLPPKPRRQKHYQDLLMLLEKGCTQTQAAEQLKVSKQRVNQMVKKYDLDFSNNTIFAQWEKTNTPWVQRYAAQGLTPDEVATALGFSTALVRKWAKNSGINFRPATRAPRTLVG